MMIASFIRGVRRRACAVLLGLLSACSGTAPDGRASVRLNPWLSSPNGGFVEYLADRETHRPQTLSAPLDFVLSFPYEVEPRTLKLHGAHQVQVTVGNAAPLIFESEGWQAQPLVIADRTRSIRMRLDPTGPEARLSELEVWGVGPPSAPRDPRLLAEASKLSLALPFENAREYRAQPASLILHPVGEGADQDCGRARVEISGVQLRGARRAFLAYEARGVQRAWVLQRSLNGHSPVGGLWLGGGGMLNTLVDEVNPELLTGHDGITLCLPPEATQPVEVNHLRVLLELDDGTNTLDRDAQARLGAAFDGDSRTAASLARGPLVLQLSRPTELERVGLSLDMPAARVDARTLEAQGWAEHEPVALVEGWNELPVAGERLSALELGFAGVAREGVPAASVAEVVITGSGVGPRVAVPRIVLTAPTLRTLAGGDVGERFGDQAYVAGWAESPYGPGVVEVDGVPAGTGDGSFGLALQRPVGQSGPWEVTLRARFPNGTELSRVVRLEDDRTEALLRDRMAMDGLPGGDTERFGGENQTAWAAVEPGREGVVRLGSSVELETPAGSVARVTPVGITRKGPEAVPPLDPGMVNVTAPVGAAYRFSPPGQKFARAVKVKLPYDERLLPEGISPDQIQTFFFDPVAQRWVPLKRITVERGGQRVVSETTHFTFMLNAVLVMPDHPGPVSFNPTSIKDLKAADPSEGIDLIEPPEGSGQGSAQLGFPLRLPQARGRYQPSLSLSYDSGAGNGWLGLGWELSVFTIAVDTRFGVPRYTGDELYLLNGQMLVPVTGQGAEDCLSGERSGRRYLERVARGFLRIRRCGTSTTDFHWEVTDKQGTVFIYGRNMGAQLRDPSSGNIAEWMLERVVDTSGNATLFDYATDEKGKAPTAGPFARDNSQDWRRLYLKTLRYSARVASPYAQPSGAVYQVSFLQEGQQTVTDSPTERPDVVTSGRTGFKVATRFRLMAVRVALLEGEDRGVIREYTFDYGREHTAGTLSFGRSLLTAIRVKGAGPRGGDTAGPEFYAHQLDYYRSTASDRSFSAPTAWNFEGSGRPTDAMALSETKEHTTRDGTYVGLAPPMVPLKSFSSGRSWGSTQGERRMLGQLVDVNGDGLPDRVRGAEVRFNQSMPVATASGGFQRLFRFSPLAPYGDPAASSPVSFNGGQPLDLLREVLEGEDSAWETHFPLGQGSVGRTMLRSDALRVLQDADGDGFVDLVSGRGVLFSKPRQAGCPADDPDCCPAGDICFRKDVLTALLAAGGELSEDPLLQAMARRRDALNYPTDALVRWLAPATGRVELSGSFRKLRAAPVEGDGVRLQVFRQPVGDAPVLLATFSAGPTDSSVKNLVLPAIDVLAGDAVFFKLSTGTDVPLGREGTRDMGLDEVALEPELRYSHFCSARGASCVPVPAAVAGAVDPSGHPVVRYTLKDDLRVAGSPWMGVQIPIQADVTLGGTVTKRPTADNVTVCIQQFAVGQVLGDRPCGPGDVVHRFAWNASESVPVSITRRVVPGTQVVFRVESETPVDPGALTWRSSVKYLALCPMESGPCQQPSADERARLDKPVEPLYDVHTPALDGAPRVYVVPRSGRAVLSSQLQAAVGAGPIQVVIHRGRERLLKASGSHASSVELDVSVGDVLFVRAYSERPESYTWNVALRFPGAGSQGADLSYAVEEKNRAVQCPVMPFSGGYRGFGVGEWNSREAFDPRRITAFDPNVWEGLSEDEVQQLIKERLSDPNSAESKSLELFAPLLPRQYPSALNEGPAWTSVAGLTFVAQGRAHAARKQSQLPSETGQDPRSLELDGVVRTSVNEGDGINLGLSTPYFGLGLAGSLGPTTSLMESLDMNGDGLLDAVSSGSVRLTRPGDYASDSPFPLGGALRSAKGFSLMFSPSSGGVPQEQGSSGGAPKEVSATDIISAAAGLALGQHSLGVGRDEGENDLIDVNGDGLPDRVERTADGQSFRVWLNLGTRFAENADALPAAEWQTAVDGFFFNGVQQAIRDGIRQVVPGVEWPKVTRTSALRHTTTMTMMSSWGASFGIGSGASAGISYQGSVARTSVDLMDVNGDGLPDLVKKGAFDSGLRVQLNQGHGFAPEEEWTMPGWGNIPGPKLRFVIDNRNLSDALLSLGIGRSGEVDGLSMNVSYSDPNSWGLSAGVGLDVSFLCPFCPSVIVEKSYSESSSRSGFEIGLQDLDGDGVVDHVLKNSDTPDVIFARMGNLGASRVGLLKSVTRPLGGSFEVAYERVGNTVAVPQSRWVMSEVVVRDGRGGTGAHLVPGHDFRTTYRYEDGYYDRTEKEFYGFARVIRQFGDGTVGGDGRRVEQMFRNDDYSLRGLLLTETLTDKDGRVFLSVTNEYVDGALGVAPDPCRDRLPHPLSTQRKACTLEFPQLVQTTKELCEGGSVCLLSTQKYRYDPLFGNVIHFEELGDAGTSDDVVADILYPRPDSTLGRRYIVGMPLEVAVKDRGGRLLRNRQGDYDDRGQLRTFSNRIDMGRLAVTTLEWTASGNLMRVEGPPNEAGQRYTVEYGYDTLTDTYVTSTVDSFELSSSVGYDLRFGIPTRTTDVNGNISNQVLDSFGRVVDVYGPYDAGTERPTVHFEYRQAENPARALTEHKLPPGSSGAKPTLDTVMFVDGLRRTLQLKKDAEVHQSGKGFSVSGKVVFDVAGQMAQQGQSVFSQSGRWEFVDAALVNPTLLEHDIRGRVIRTTAADGTVISMQYSLVSFSAGGPLRLSTRITDGNGHVRVTYRDAVDRVLAVQEHIQGRSPTTHYEYNPLGELTAIVDAAGNRTELTYDLLGRRLSLFHLDAGLVEQVYDAAGNLVARWDPSLRAAGVPIRYQYDFNRLIAVDYPRSEDVRFTYGGKGKRPENDAGRIREVWDEAGRELRSYGRLGELVETTRVLRPLRPGDKPRALTLRFETDSFGRVLSIQYPDGEVVRYSYDAGGLLAAAVGERPAPPRGPAQQEVYVRSLAYDVFGQRVRMESGNGVITELRYEPKTRRLEHLRTTLPSGRKLQALTYSYDPVGNVRSITNALGAPVGNRSGAVSYSFEYDALDRLRVAHGSILSRPGVEDRFYSVFEYSDIHNLMRKQQVREIVTSLPGGGTIERPDRTNHDEAYIYGGTGPHQATRIGETFIEYDLNGNTLAECRSPQGLPCDVSGPGEVPGGDVSQTHLRRYVWSEDNRLSASVDGGGRNLTRFLYDASGIRVVKLGQGGPSVTVGQFFALKGRQYATKHIFAGTTRIASKSLPPPEGRVGGGNGGGTGSPPGLEDNEHGCEPSNYQPNKCPQPVADPTGPQAGGGMMRPATYYYHPDHLGSASWMTDAAARVYEHVEYFPYGEVWREERGDSPGQNQIEPTFRFTGKPFDEETGLMYFGARYYDARKARWLSVDNLDRLLREGAHYTAPEMSVYAYARLNPLVYVDPDGEKPIIMIGPNLEPPEKTVKIRDRDNPSTIRGTATFEFGDPRNLPGIQVAARKFAKTQLGLSDIDSNTRVVSVNSKEDVEKFLKESNEQQPGGSKVYFGHAALALEDVTDPKNFATGLDLGREKMSGPEFKKAIDEAGGGTPIAAMCMGGTLTLSEPGAKSVEKAVGPQNAVMIKTGVNFKESSLMQVVRGRRSELGTGDISGVWLDFDNIGRNTEAPSGGQPVPAQPPR